jgi:hypothetical protein
MPSFFVRVVSSMVGFADELDLGFQDKIQRSK